MHTAPPVPSGVKRALLAELLAQRRAVQVFAPVVADPVIEPRPAGSAMVLSYQQERLFALDQIVDDMVAYNQAQAYRIAGGLDATAMAQAVHELQLRHDILRTRVRLRDGMADLHVGEPVPLEQLDVACGPRNTAAVRALVEAQVRRPIELGRTGPLRMTLLRLAADDHVLVMSLHHIACDDVSKRVLLADLGELYSASLSGRATPTTQTANQDADQTANQDADQTANQDALVPSTSPRLQFADYAAWQRADLEGPRVREDVGWWQETLRDAPTLTSFPLDRPRPVVATNEGAKLRHRLPEGSGTQLEQLAQQMSATPYMVMLASFAYVLEIFGRDGEVVIGSPMTGRGRPELKDVVGLFLNTLPVRIDTSGDITFRDLLARVRESVVGVLAHQEVPFELILDAVRPPRDPSYTPLFQAMFTMRSEASGTPALGGLEVEPVGYDGGWTKFDLGVTCIRSGASVELLWQYSTELFDASTVQRLADTLDRLVGAVLADPDAVLGELVVPTGDELEQVLTAWNDTAVHDFPAVAVHELFEQQVDRTPTAPAVSDATRSLTYSQLDVEANRLAHELIAAGARVGDIVAIAMQRGVEAEIAILGVLKAGAAYLPIDPGYPPTRIAFMLRDSQAALVLTDRASTSAVPIGTPRLVLDTPVRVTAGRPDTRVARAVTAADLAYVIYTSGSTGQPKGVLCEHGGLVNRLSWMARELQVTPADVVLQKTPMTFDVSVWELLLPVTHGAHLTMAAPGRHGDPDHLREVIDRRGVTITHFVPSMLAAFVRAVDAGACASVRAVIASGEALPDAVAAATAIALPAAQLYNMYGPTEASIDVTSTRYDPDDPRPLTIGTPIANMRVYVLDPHRRPVPVGAPGELYLAGVGVARGYLNRPDLVAERFGEDSFHGGRMYRTGDKARWRTDGHIEYLGRLDDQVKLRGFRIELGEVEGALGGLDGVAAAVCTIRGAGDGGGADDRLVAFVVPTDPTSPLDPGALRSRLMGLLPAYEVPSAIGIIDEIPLSANGKVDRRRLPAINQVVADRVRIQPRNELEERIARTWRAVLGSDVELSVDDDFFDVGGHSLSALRLFSAIERECRVKVPLSMVIQGVTIADIADYVRQAQHNTDEVGLLVPMRTSGELAPLFVMPGMRGDVLVYRQMVPFIDDRYPVYGVQCRGTDGRVAPRSTIEEIAQDCIGAMRQVQASGPYYVLGYCFSGIVAYEVARQLVESGEQIAFVGVIDAAPPRATLPATAGGRWRRRIRILTRGGLNGLVPTVQAFLTRRTRRLVAVTYGRLGLRIPPRLIDFYYANKMAQLTYRPRPADLRVTLIRKADVDAEIVPRSRWVELARDGLDEVLLDSRGVDHHKIVQSRFVDRVAEAINTGLDSAGARR